MPASNPQPKAPASSLSEETLVNAIVMAKSTSDNVVLHTEFGNFRITTPTPLTVGSHIVFEVTESQEVILARLLAMNGKNFSPPLEVRLLPTIEKAISGAEGYIKAGQLHPLELKSGLQNLAPSLPPAAKGEVVPQTLRPLPTAIPDGQAASKASATPSISGFTTIQTDGAVKANSNGVSIYQRYHSPAFSSVQDLLTTPASQILKVPELLSANRYGVVEAEVLRPPRMGHVETSKGPVALVEGQKVNLIVRPQQAAYQLNPRADIYQGTVIAQTRATTADAAARVTLQTPIGTISYNTASPPATGTNVQFAIANEISAFPLTEADVRLPGERLPKIAAMGDWRNLRDSLNLVAQADPIVAQTVISHVIPQANAQLSNSLLFFMAALNLGSIEKWLGQEFAHALKTAGRGQLLQALEDDFATFSRLQGDAGGQDWKSLNFPFFDGANLRQVRMFYRQHKNPDEADPEKETTRFVIELNLSKSGQVQLDGLFKRRLFNLAVRSHKDISEDMRLHIGKLFNEHMEISGLKGQLIFKTATPFPVDPLSEWESKPADAAT